MVNFHHSNNKIKLATMAVPYLQTVGLGSDIETFAYKRGEFVILPDPPGLIPFHSQGQPIPDYQQNHVNAGQVEEATHFLATNPWPFTRFVGEFHRQIHQPQFLSVNEQIFYQ